MKNDTLNTGPVAPQQVIYAYPPDFAALDDEELDLRKLWNILWRGKWIIIAVTGVFAIASVFFVLALPNRYQSQALLAPSEEAQGGGISQVAGQLGGLASLAGINLGSGEGGNKVAVALKVLESRRFITKFIEQHEILPELMAVKNWNRSDNALVYDTDVYNPETGDWVRDVDPPKTPKPSHWEAYEAFTEIFSVSQNRDDGFVTLSVEHYSPYIAEQWVSLLINAINTHMKEEDVGQAQRSIEFLNEQLDKVTLAEMRTVFYQLVEEQIQTMMLAEVRSEYIFSTIDPPVVPEEKSAPSRALICILITLVGGLIGVVSVFMRALIRRERVEK